MIRNHLGVVRSEKEAADYLRDKYGIRKSRGVPFIRDYRCKTLAQARYSLALLRRDFRLGLHTPEQYAAINARLRAAIFKFSGTVGAMNARQARQRQT